ncbi:MAG: serine/threonine protein kinase [Coriobacteriales bacterium]
MDSNLLLDRYVIQETLGSGSGGVVNLAWDTRMQRNVAIKRIELPVHQDLAQIPGLEEARTGAQLHDSRIVNVFDFEVTDDEALLIMEFVDGISLGALMDRIPRMLTLDEIASIVQNVGKALQHAHQHHVLHLDVKPDNILIDTTGMSKMTDFGIGRLARLGGFGEATAGTIGYMPPEQLRGEEITEKSDQWAFAVVVYELLVGEDPFIRDTFDESLQAMQHEEIPLPSASDEELDPAIDDVIFKALSLDPAERYPSVAKFVAALNPYLGTARTGRSRLGKLVSVFGDEIALGSPEERMAAIRDMDDLYEPGDQLQFDEMYYDDETEPLDVQPDYDVDGYGEDAIDPYDERRVVKRRSYKNILGDRGVSIIARVVAAACNAALAYLGMVSIPLPLPWAGWALVGIAAIVGVIIPRVAPLVSMAILAFGMVCADWIPQAVILIIAGLAWWIFVGRKSNGAANCGVLAPAAGLLGFAYLQPLFTGYLLRWREALVTGLFGVALMLLVYPLTGSGELFKTSLGFIPNTTAMRASLVEVYWSAELWIYVVAWLVATLAMSVLANRGSKALSMVGAVISTAIIVISRVMYGIAGGTLPALMTVDFVFAVLLPLVIVCVAVWIHAPRAGGSN